MSNLFSDAMSYFHNRYLFQDMFTKIDNNPYIQNGSVNSWLTGFANYLQQSEDPFVVSQLDTGKKITCNAFFAFYYSFAMSLINSIIHEHEC